MMANGRKKVIGSRDFRTELRNGAIADPQVNPHWIPKTPFSEKEGVSLNQFLNVAVAEKLAHLEHEEWVRSRKQPSKELAARALRLLDKAGNKPVETGDELPKAYRATRR